MTTSTAPDGPRTRLFPQGDIFAVAHDGVVGQAAAKAHRSEQETACAFSSAEFRNSATFSP